MMPRLDSEKNLTSPKDPLKILPALIGMILLLPVVTGGVRDCRGAETPVEKEQRGVSAADPSGVDFQGDPLPPGARMRLGTTRFHPPQSVRDLAVAPDGQTVVTLSEQLIAWDAQTGRERWRASAAEVGITMTGAGYGSRGLAFAADGTKVYTPGPSNKILAWDPQTGQHEVVQLPSKLFTFGARQGAAAIDVSPDGQRLALGSTTGVVVCDLKGKRQFSVKNSPPAQPARDNNDRLGFFGDYSFCRFAPDGRSLAVVTSGRPDVIQLVEAQSGELQGRIELGAKMVRLAFTPDGKRLAVTERDSAVRMYERETTQRVWEQKLELNNPFENYTSGITCSPDGKLVAVGATDNRLHLLDAETGAVAGTLEGHFWYPWALEFSPDSRMLYSAGWDCLLRRWDVAARRQLDPPEGIHASEVVAASPDGRTLAYQDDRGTVRLVDATSGQERRQLASRIARFSQLLFSPDGKRLAGGGAGAGEVRVQLWNLPGGEEVHHWSWPLGRDPHSKVEALSFTSDGARLAAAVFRQNAAYVWDTHSGEQLAELSHPSIYGLAHSSDGQTLATVGWDSILRLWEVGGYTVSRELNLKENNNQAGDLRMYAVAYAPEGGLLATAHLDGTVRVWQADDLQLRATFQVPGRFVYGALRFSPDGLWLATGAAGGQVELWDPLSGQVVWQPGKHAHYVYTVDFGRDSRT
ncbi:MAG: WD40 repeat domain-containing protein, partial [Planctomycetales bacterium]